MSFADLTAAGIGPKDSVTVLADKLTGRIAIRKGRDGEPSIKPYYNKSRTGRIGISPALAAIGKKIEAVVGRYQVSTKDDLMIVQLR